MTEPEVVLEGGPRAGWRLTLGLCVVVVRIHVEGTRWARYERADAERFVYARDEEPGHLSPGGPP